MFYTVSQVSDIWESTCVLEMFDYRVFAWAHFMATATNKVSYEMACNVSKWQCIKQNFINLW